MTIVHETQLSDKIYPVNHFATKRGPGTANLFAVPGPVI